MRQTEAIFLSLAVLFADHVQAVAQTQPPATGQPPQNCYWPGPWHMMWGGGWIFPFIIMLMCFGAMVFMMRGGMMGRHHGDHSLDILRERFARGEINQSEYEERRRFLG